MAAAYPSDVKVFIDDEDITKRIFGQDTITLTDVNNIFHDINIAPYVKYPGRHKLKITAASGAGRVDARISIK